MNIEECYTFKFKYELIDNEDTTQSLFVKTYQGPSLISEIDLGNICGFIAERKYKENLIKYMEDKIEEIQKNKKGWTHPIPINNSELLIEHYTNLLERIKSGKYE